jgi:hypothetical protein
MNDGSIDSDLSSFNCSIVLGNVISYIHTYYVRGVWPWVIGVMKYVFLVSILELSPAKKSLLVMPPRYSNEYFREAYEVVLIDLETFGFVWYQFLSYELLHTLVVSNV